MLKNLPVPHSDCGANDGDIVGLLVGFINDHIFH